MTMAKKKKNDYFEMLTNQTAFSVQAAELLEKIICNYNSDEIIDMHNKMHEIEQSADVLHHEIVSNLAIEFITPIDQEDILRLVQIIDDITDALDEVTLDFYMYNLKEVPQGADEFSKLVSSCVKALLLAVKELKNFKKPEKLRDYIIEVNSAESNADAVYTEAIHNLFASDIDSKALIGSNAIFESLENCCDLCEHAADIIEQIIMKNT